MSTEESIPCPLLQARTTLGLVALSPRPPPPHTAQAWLKKSASTRPGTLQPVARAASSGPPGGRAPSSCGNNTRSQRSGPDAAPGGRSARSGSGDPRPARPPARSTAPAPRRGRGLAGRHLGRLSRRRVYHSMVARSRPAPPQSLSGGAAAAAAPSLYKPQCPDVNGLQCIFQGNLLLSM